MKPGQTRVSLAVLSAAIRPTKTKTKTTATVTTRSLTRALDMGCGGPSGEKLGKTLIREIVT